MWKETIENMDNQQLCEKILNLCILNEIKNSNLDLNIIMNQIKIYETKLSYLKDDKPLFFQKEKLKNYNEQIEKINEKIKNLYTSLSDELDIIYKLSDEI